MTSPPTSISPIQGPRGTFLLVLGLWGMAVAQPLLDLLGRTAAFFVAHAADRTDLILFAVAITLAGPLALATIVLLVRAFGVPTRRLEAAVWGLLAALLAAHWMSRWAAHPSWVALLAIGAGTLAALALLRWPATRTLVRWLGAVAWIFPMLFLFSSPASKISAGPEDSGGAVSTVAALKPLTAVLLVLDELPLVSLLDEEELIDGGRYPNLAALAETATWYRNATTVAQSTAYAVPAILSGKYPSERQVTQPVWSDHKKNLFTIIGRGANMHVVETLSRLCPAALCFGGAYLAPRQSRFAAMVRDAGAVYLHQVTPSGWSSRLPEIGESWRDFWAADDDGRGSDGKNAYDQDSAAVFDRFIQDLSAFPPPSLHYLHLMTPHLPWDRLPDGTNYPTRQRAPHGLSNQAWRGSEWATVQAQQRHLLQVGWADGLIGRLRAALEELGLWRDAIVIVTSDHGTSFETGERRRNLTPKNLAEIVNVPLLIKYPGQSLGVIDESNVETIDIMPTLLAALGAKASPSPDGHDLAGRRRRATKTVYHSGLQGSGAGAGQVFDIESVLERGRAVERKIERFGTTTWNQVFAAGPISDLVGQPIGSLRGIENPPAGPFVHLDRARDFDAVDLELEHLPVHITGWLTRNAEAPPLDLVVTVNGIVRASAETFPDEERSRFTAMIPKDALVNGKNTIEIFRVSGPPGTRWVRRLLGQASPTNGSGSSD